MSNQDDTPAKVPAKVAQPQLFCPACDRWTAFTEEWRTVEERGCDYLYLVCGQKACGQTRSINDWAEATAAVAGDIRAQIVEEVAGEIAKWIDKDRHHLLKMLNRHYGK